MLRVIEPTTEGLVDPIGIDEANPQLCWKLVSDDQNVVQNTYHVVVQLGERIVWDSGIVASSQSVFVAYAGEALKPFTLYSWRVTVTDNRGETAESGYTIFETGRLGTPWHAKWITTSSQFDDDSVTPTHIYKKTFAVSKEIKRARIYASSLGVYSLSIGRKIVGDRFFAPGYTDYKRHVQYQTYDVTSLISAGENTLMCEVAGGWYTGRLALILKGNRYGKKRALILELHIDYEDGTSEVVTTDESFSYTSDGPRLFAGFYDGEIYDANREDGVAWQYDQTKLLKGKTPAIVPDIGLPVIRHEKVYPVASHAFGDSIIYKFERNFAGIVNIELDTPKGQRITISHAEILKKDGDLSTVNLRSAKAQLVYISKGGKQTYEPRFTYMGFQYVKIEGLTPSQIKSVSAYELYSDLNITGSFACSNELINRLQANILTSQKSNFFDIPTDNAQRDERAAWTGDIAMFSKTASFNMNVGRFMRKWLRDLRSEQSRNHGNIPFIVPSGNIFYMKFVTSPIWSDAAVIIPWDAYMSTGDLRLLREQYPSMKRWVNTFKRMTTFGKLPIMKSYYVFRGFSFADWLAPECSIPDQIFKRGKWMATAYLANSVRILGETSRLLGYSNEAEVYKKTHNRICRSFCDTLLDDQNQIKQGFQSIYATAVRFGILPNKARVNAVGALEEDIIRHDDHLMTGFAGTPHVPFALADNGKEETAFRLLLQESCPSWLYPVKCGATSIWERWDAVREDGSVNETPQMGKNNMVSLNTYAYGAIGEFLYSRVAGLEAIEGGYKHFKVAPKPGGGIRHASASFESPYGTIRSKWNINADCEFHLWVTVPVNTQAEIKLPDGQTQTVGSGEHHFTCK